MDESVADRQPVEVEAAADTIQRIVDNLATVVHAPADTLRLCVLCLVDEINRASPKTQAALLECMQENQVTIDGQTHELVRPFMVMATQNPIEYEGTYPLPEAQLDRFTMRLSLGYPPLADEAKMLTE